MKKYSSMTLLMLLIVAADQIAKMVVRSAMQVGQTIVLIDGFFDLSYVRNRGVAFGMFSGKMFVTIVVALALMVLCFVMMMQEHRNGSYATSTCFAVILAGGLSNLIDRALLGYVTDMFSLHGFAVFNVADIGVTGGCVLLIILLIKDMVKGSSYADAD